MTLNVENGINQDVPPAPFLHRLQTNLGLQFFCRWPVRWSRVTFVTFNFVIPFRIGSRVCPKQNTQTVTSKVLFPILFLYVKNIFGPMPLFLLLSTQTMHFKLIVQNCITTVSLNTLCPCGIRTRVFCFCGGCDVHCATPPSRPKPFFYLMTYN
jgi:hypothetical protein